MSPQPVAGPRAAGSGSVEELQEVGVTARYVGSDAERGNARLNNNPINVIRSGSNVSPDEISVAANAPTSEVIAHVVSTAPHWRVGEENHYWTQRFTYYNAFRQHLSEDDATRSAAGLYQQDVRDQVATIQRQNEAVLLDAFTPYGHAKNLGAGLWNLGVKTVGGALSAPVALTGVDNALSVQDWVSGARINVDSPFAEMVGQSLRPSMNQAQAWLEDKIGIGGTAFLGAAAEFALDAAVVVPATASLRRLAPQLDIPLAVRNPFAAEVSSAGALRQRVLANIAESQAAREASRFDVHLARTDQILGGYAADEWGLATVQAGSTVFGGLPGQSAYYTSAATLEASGGSRTSLFQSLQVREHPEFGYRPKVGEYEVLRTLRVPAGAVRANPSFGGGLGDQFFIRDYESSLRLIREIPLKQ